MPFQDVIQDHFSVTDETDVNTAIDNIIAKVQAKLRNLSEDENNTYGSVNEQNKLLINKVWDYRKSQPTLSSPDVDWTEFEADAFDRAFLEKTALRLEALAKTLLETKRLHDYDNFQNSLTDYRYTNYKKETQPGLGYDSKAAELKQFFPATGTGGGN